MSLCLNGTKLIVEWQYPGEEKNRIIKADNYSVIRTESQCAVTYNLKYQTINQQGILDTNKTYSTSGVMGPIYAWGLTRTFQNQVALGLKQDYCGINSNPECGATRPYQKWFYHRGGKQDINKNPLPTGTVNGYTFSNLGSGWGFKLFDLARSDGQPDNCGDYIFKILNKEGQVVYQRTDFVSPAISHYCQNDESCPFGTCECTNGSTVCCYDTKTGKVVKSFTR